MSSSTALKKITEALATSFFDVTEEKCLTAGGQEIPGKKVICRKDDGSPLAVVGDRYKVVTNEELFSSFTQVLGKSEICLDGAKVNTHFSHGGARTFAEIILPGHDLKVGGVQKVGDVTQLRLIARNSYDGSTAFMVQTGGYRLACLNGQVTGTTVGYFAGKHVSSLDVKTAVQNVSNMLDSFNASQEWFSELRSKKVTDKQAYACLAFASRNQEALRQGIPSKMEEAPPMMRTLFDSWTLHKKTMGDNAWSLYNTMTHFSTHWDTDKEKDEQHANAAAARFRREDRIRETLQSPIWTKLAA